MDFRQAIRNFVVGLLAFTASSCSNNPINENLRHGGDGKPNGGANMELATSLSSFFSFQSTGYASNGSQYCLVPSEEQWLAMGAPASGYPVDSKIPSGLSYAGQCPLPSGFFSYDSTGYWANSGGQYCTVTSMVQWNAMGAPASGYPTYTIMPTSMAYVGQCALPIGFFSYDSTGYLASAGGKYCSVISMAQWNAMGAPASGYPVYTVLPNSMAYVGQCALPNGFFSYDSAGYLSSGGKYCYVDSWPHWLFLGGPTIDFPAYPSIPSSMTNTGVCALPSLPILAGSWVTNGFLCNIAQNGGSLTLTNEHGSATTGTFTSAETVYAWGMQGTLSADEQTISWANGSTWTRWWQANPPAPKSLTLTSSPSSNVTANWTSGGGNTAAFYVVFQPGPNAPGCNATGSPAGLANTFLLSGLGPSTQYTVGLCATDAAGDVSPEIQQTITTPPSPVPPPTAFQMGQYDVDTGQVSANSPTTTGRSQQFLFNTGGGSTVSLFVVYQPGPFAPVCNSSGKYVGPNDHFSNSNTYSSFIIGLQPLTEYSIGVCAVDANWNVSSELVATFVTPADPGPEGPDTNVLGVCSPFIFAPEPNGLQPCSSHAGAAINGSISE